MFVCSSRVRRNSAHLSAIRRPAHFVWSYIGCSSRRHSGQQSSVSVTGMPHAGDEDPLVRQVADLPVLEPAAAAEDRQE